MRLTIVTDHRFYRVGDAVYDDYVFNYDFFLTYRKVFEEIRVVARVRNATQPDARWTRSDGPGVSFIDIPDVHGAKWLLGAGRYLRSKRETILDTDAFCFRLPSQAAWEVYRYNHGKLPFMFESIGSPEDAMTSSGDGFLKRVLFGALGALLNRRKRRIVSEAVTGSYVSLGHLQQKFPVAVGVPVESISSIRLQAASIIGSKPFPHDHIRIIHVGSFIPLKNQKDLLTAFSRLRQAGLDLYLDLVGEGATRPECMQLASTLGVDDRVTFHGQVTGFHNIQALLDRATFFVLPSTNEGMPRSLIEAMARGLICFGSAVGGIAELLPASSTFVPGDSEKIAALIADFIKNSDDARYQEVSQANIATASNFEFGELERRRLRILNILKAKSNE